MHGTLHRTLDTWSAASAGSTTEEATVNDINARRLHLVCLLLMGTAMMAFPSTALSQGTIIDHSCTDITAVPTAAIEQARATLHIAYGHTSHGSQLTDGMTGLVAFANGGGLGLSHPADIFAWNDGGTGGALDLEEGDGYGTGWLDHDCGYYPNWVDETVEYLDDPSHADVNVIIWSWCGQASGLTEQQMIDTYLAPMTQLELDYPGVTFVYMTGHAEGTGLEGYLHLRNQQIRDYCIANDKVLFDFYDIECYDPDGTYFGDQYVDDGCNYTGGNWAIEWQDSHVEGVDWYVCGAAHTQPLNANQKAYACWWLWATLAGWDPTSGAGESGTSLKARLHQNSPNPFNPATTISFTLNETCDVTLSVHTMGGRLIERLVDGRRYAGSYDMPFDSRSLPSGMYFCVLKAGSSTDTMKMVLLK